MIVADLCGQLEACGRSGDLSATPELFQQLEIQTPIALAALAVAFSQQTPEIEPQQID